MSTGIDPIFRGDTIRLAFEFTDSAGAAIDITGHAFTATLKADLDDPDAAAAWQVSVVAGGSEALAGRVEIVVPASGAAGPPPDHNGNTAPGDYHLDVQRVISGSPDDVTTVHYQQLRVKADVTRTV